MPWDRIAPGIWIGQPYLRRGDETWCVIVKRRDYSDGSRRYVRVGTDRSDAVDVATHLLGELATAGSPTISVAGILAKFEREHLRTVRMRTEELERSIIRNHLVPAFGEKRAAELDEMDFFNFGASYLEPLEGEARFRKYALVKNSLSVLRAALNWYWRKNRRALRGTDCPAQEIGPQLERLRKRYEIPTRRPKAVYSREEASTLLAVAWQIRPVVHDLYTVGLATGMRLGEILGIQWEDIDWFNCELRGEWKISKYGTPERYKVERAHPIVFPEGLRDLLQRRRAERTSERWVFATAKGTPYLQSNIHKWIGKVRAAAAKQGVPADRTFHATRHTFASLGLQATGDLEFIRNQLGHHSAAFTASVYSHMVPGRRKIDWLQSGHRVVTGGHSEVAEDAKEDTVTPRSKW